MSGGKSLNATNNYISSNFLIDHTEIVVDRNIIPSSSKTHSLGTEEVPFHHMYLSGNIKCDGILIGNGSQLENVISSTGVLKTNISETLCQISNIKYIPSVLSNDTYFKAFNVSILSNSNVVLFSVVIYRIYKVLDNQFPDVKTTHDVNYHIINSYYETNVITSDSNSVTFNGNTINFDVTNNDPSTESLSVSLTNDNNISIISV